MGGSISRVSIELSNPSGFYNPGEVVEGKIILRNATSVKVKRITVYLDGVGKVHWSEEESYTEDSTEVVNGETVTVPKTYFRMVNFKGKETYVEKYKYLVGIGSPSLRLDAGTYSYPFRFKLPENLPSSFKGDHGSVWYCVSAKLKRSFPDHDIWENLPIHVNGKLDLNLWPRANKSGVVEKISGVNFCVCKNGGMSFILRLPQKSGFIPGEVLEYYVEICNESNRRVVGTRTSLLQRIKFRAQGKQKEVKNVIGTVKGFEIEKKEHKVWTCKGMKIPESLPPTGLGGARTCEIIHVQYSLQMEMKFEGAELLINGELPILIGTIPFNTSTSVATRRS